MILALFVAEPLAAEQTALANGAEAADGIAPLLDRLGARLGLGALNRLEARASHLPERASVYVPVGEKRPEIAGATEAEKPPRPIRLFAVPEPVEATWLLPDDPPVRFTWRRRAYRVNRADGPERIADEWWVEGGSLAADAIRDYYRVEDDAGRRFWLFRAGLPGDPPPRWFVHGIFA
jgi:protein ImuB